MQAAEQIPIPDPIPEGPGLTDMPPHLFRDIITTAALDNTRAAAGGFTQANYLRETQRLANTSRDFMHASRDMQEAMYPFRHLNVGLHTNPRAMAAIERAQQMRLLRPYLPDDAGDPMMPVRVGGVTRPLNLQEGLRQGLVTRRGVPIGRGRDDEDLEALD